MKAPRHIFRLKPLALSVLVVCSNAVYAQPPSHIPSIASDKLAMAWERLPESKLRDKLESLPEKAQQRAKAWLDKTNFQTGDVPFMRADDNGGVFFVDTFKPVETTTDFTVEAQNITTENTVSDVFSLHSKPDSNNVIFLDFDGHVVTGTAWNNTHETLNALPYDLDGDPSSFSATETQYIAEVWRRVSEDYAAFDVDVTTEEPSQFNSTTGRLLITKSHDANGNPMPASSAGGVAYVGVWGANYYPTYSPAFVYFNNLGGGRPDYVSEAASHEMGHNMSLSHDGTSTSSYYGGHGSGYTSWSPIMGIGYGRHVTQWSKGEYPNASQSEDDVAIIASKVGFRSDDHANQTGSATPLVTDANGSVLALSAIDNSEDNKGNIHIKGDVDVFTFSTTGGTVSLQAIPALEANFTRGGNLDIVLSLYDSAANLLAESNPADDTLASVESTVGSGTFYVAVKATGSDNYTDYGSVGRYTLQGSIPVTTDVSPPSPSPMAWATVPHAIDHQRIDMKAVTAIDDQSTVEYFFECLSTETNCVSSGWTTRTSYSATGLKAETTYRFRVKARDISGNETLFSPEALATTTVAPAINHPPQANDDVVEVLMNATTVIPVLENDTDPEEDNLTITVVSQASKGQVSTDGSQVSFTAGKRRGDDSFTYTISDGNGNVATASVYVSISRNLSGEDSTDGGSGKPNKGRK